MTIYKICALGKLLYLFHFLLQLSNYTITDSFFTVIRKRDEMCAPLDVCDMEQYCLAVLAKGKRSLSL